VSTPAGRSGVLLGIDIGTSSAKVLACGSDGSVLGRTRVPYGMKLPRPGWAEQDPDDWWRAACTGIGRVLHAASIDPGQVSAVGLSGQMHGLVPLGRDGSPARDAIIWPDNRSEKECDFYKEIIPEPDAYFLTGLPVVPGIFGPSLLWLQAHEPDAAAASSAFLLPKDYVRLRLTGEIATDETDAGGTLLFDVRRRQWAADLIGALGLDQSALPPVLRSAQPAGRVHAAAARQTGLREGTLVAAGGGDQAMGAVGVGAVRPGVVALSLGTGGQVVTTLEAPVLDPGRRTHLLCHAIDDTWLLMGATLTAGLALHWLEGIIGESPRRDPADTAASYAELITEAGSVPAGADGLIFLPYLAGERTPYMDRLARGCFVGLTLEHGRGNLTRAVLEGVSYSLNQALEIFGELGVPLRTLIGSGGGTKDGLWMRIQASVSDHPIIISAVEEHAAYGAALTAGLAAGVLGSLEDVTAPHHAHSVTVFPDPAEAAVYRRSYSIYRDLYPALRGTFKRLNGA
jgi:xylulokinase